MRRGWQVPETDFERFYVGRYRSLVAEMTLLTGSQQEAEDLAQEAFARAWLRWTKISDYDDPAAWLRRVAFNMAVSRWRQLRRAARQIPRLAQPDAAPAPDGDWLDLQRALMRLGTRQRSAIVMLAVEDLSAADIAESMGVAEATVRSWLHRARTELADVLSDSDRDRDQGAKPRELQP